MYENGNKVGIIGSEDEPQAHVSAAVPPEDCPEPTGEVIDQTINEVPKKNSTPPNYQPDTMPPAE